MNELEQEVEYCAECGQEILDYIEAAEHTFILKNSAIYFHRMCCPILLREQVCKSFAHQLDTIEI